MTNCMLLINRENKIISIITRRVEKQNIPREISARAAPVKLTNC